MSRASGALAAAFRVSPARVSGAVLGFMPAVAAVRRLVGWRCSGSFIGPSSVLHSCAGAPRHAGRSSEGERAWSERVGVRVARAALVRSIDVYRRSCRGLKMYGSGGLVGLGCFSKRTGCHASDRLIVD